MTLREAATRLVEASRSGEGVLEARIELGLCVMDRGVPSDLLDAMVEEAERD